jgi:hypothetical protein
MHVTEPLEQSLGQASQALMQYLTGFWVSQSICAIAEVGVADELKEGPASIAILAQKLKVDEDGLFRVMRALSSLGIFRETGDRVFDLTPMAALLLSDEPNSMRAIALMLGKENYQAWGNLGSALQSGDSAFELTYGMNAYAYFEKHPESAARFHAAMTALVSHDHSAILKAYDFSLLDSLIDVGGGHGLLLAKILSKHPSLSATLFDLASVITEAEPLLSQHGVLERCRLEAGDFYDSVPEGGDGYLLSRVLHGFGDQQCIQILQNIHSAMPSSGKLLIMEFILQPGNDITTAKTKFMDVNMLVFAPGGRDRQQEEYEKLLKVSGFQLTRILPTETSIAIMEATKL